MIENPSLFMAIVIIGIATLFLRAIFLFFLPKIIKHPLVRRGMDAVPASMLVALVLPFTIYLDQQLSLFRNEVYAMILSIPVIYISRKYSYGLIFAFISYFLLEFISI